MGQVSQATFQVLNYPGDCAGPGDRAQTTIRGHVRGRVAQMAATLVLEPIFEAAFHPCSYGFWPKRNATQALETLRRSAAKCRSSRLAVKSELGEHFESNADAKMELVDYVEVFYNQRCRHSTLGQISPAAYE